MKSAINFFLIGLVSIALSCGDTHQPEENSVQQDFTGMASLDLKVDGMKCEFGCAKTIEKKVSEMAGVGGCFVKFEEGVAKVYYDNETIKGQDIIAFIGNLNDGSYEVSEVGNNEETDSDNESKKSIEKKTNVFSPGQSFRLPELITYFLKRI